MSKESSSHRGWKAAYETYANDSRVTGVLFYADTYVTRFDEPVRGGEFSVTAEGKTIYFTVG